MKLKSSKRTECRNHPARIAAVILSAILTFLSPGQASAAENSSVIRPAISEIRADAYIVIDRNTGEMIIEHNSTKQIHPASLTKVLTSIIAIETLQRDDVITTSEYAGTLPDGESKLDLQPGETMTFEQMLYGMLMVSGNDAAVAVGEHISGTRSAFAVLMNKRSKELGTKGSSWTNPSGVTDAAHFSTSADLALLTSYALTLDLFEEVVATSFFSLAPTNKHPFTDWNVLENTNRLLRLQDLYYESAYLDEISGVKTGTTSAAGSNLITAAHSTGGLDLLCVMNGVRDHDAKLIWIYSIALLEEAAKVLDGVQTIVSSDDKVEETGTGLFKYPEKSFALYNPDNIDYSIAVSQDNGMLSVTAGDDILFETRLLSIPAESSQPAQSTAESETTIPVTGNIGKTLIIILALLGLILYSVFIWILIDHKYSRRRKKRSRY
ncbi:MAG: D-alanyl-D-alanine carboxypeptidase family protein [Saccharofermentanales bacterium]